IAARTCIDLFEFVEDARQVARRDAHTAVDHLKGHPDPAARRSSEKSRRRWVVHTGTWSWRPRAQFLRCAKKASTHTDRAGGSVLHRVADQVDQNLSQVSGIRAHSGK